MNAWPGRGGLVLSRDCLFTADGRSCTSPPPTCQLLRRRQLVGRQRNLWRANVVGSTYELMEGEKRDI